MANACPRGTVGAPVCAHVRSPALRANQSLGETLSRVEPKRASGGQAVLSAHPAEPFDGAAELLGVHARVALGGVEVLVAEQPLSLAPGAGSRGGGEPRGQTRAGACAA